MRLPRFKPSLPVVRLTAWYVAILASICLSYSVTVYHFAYDQLADSLRHQYMQFHPGDSDDVPPPKGASIPPDTDSVPASVRPDLENAAHNLVLELVYINSVIVILGGALSYWFAKRTVRPIEDSLDAQSRFTADASHELRTPLAVMQMELELAQDDPKLTLGEAKALLSSSLEEVAKLRALSDGLLQLAQIDRPLPKGPVSLRSATAQAIEHVTVQAANRSITIENHVAGQAAVRAHESSLVELIGLLLDNAIKYSPPHTAVTIKAHVAARHAVLTLTDHGRGIAPFDLPRIFDRFYRADASRTAPDVSGHGLGLSIAKRIIDLQDGRIKVASRLGHGTTFTITLPQA